MYWYKMSKNKRFELLSWHYHKLEAVVYDNLKREELYLSIYDLVDLLNNVSQQDYDLRKLGKEITDKLDEMSGMIQ